MTAAEPLHLCATCGNHGSTGRGRDRKPCTDCEYGREIARYFEQFRAEKGALEAGEQLP